MTGLDQIGDADAHMQRVTAPETSREVRARVPAVVALLIASQPARDPRGGRWLVRRWWRSLYRAARRQTPNLEDPAWPLAQAAWISRLGPTPREACAWALEDRKARMR